MTDIHKDWFQLAEKVAKIRDKQQDDWTPDDWRTILIFLAAPSPKKGKGRPKTKKTGLFGPLRKPSGQPEILPREVRRRVPAAVAHLKLRESGNETDKPISNTKACYILLDEAGVFDLPEFQEEHERKAEARRVARQLRAWEKLPETPK